MERYTLEKQVGKGAFKEVWKAYDHVRQRHVALKRFVPSNRNTNLHDALLNESRRLDALMREEHHPAIIDLLEIDPANHHIVEEWFEGGNLKERISSGSMDDVDPIRILLYVAEGLKFAHNRNIVHRDIKLENILFNGEIAKMTDFGLAEESGTESSQKGSILYCAPEEFDTKNARNAPTLDIYKWGVLAYYLLSQAEGNPHFPFESDIKDWSTLNPDQIEEQRAILEERIKQNSFSIKRRREKNLHDIYWNATLKSMQKNPEHRFKDGSELSAYIQSSVSRLNNRGKLMNRVVIGATIATLATMLLYDVFSKIKSTQRMAYVSENDKLAISDLDGKRPTTITSISDSTPLEWSGSSLLYLRDNYLYCFTPPDHEHLVFDKKINSFRISGTTLAWLSPSGDLFVSDFQNKKVNSKIDHRFISDKVNRIISISKNNSFIVYRTDSGIFEHSLTVEHPITIPRLTFHSNARHLASYQDKYIFYATDKELICYLYSERSTLRTTGMQPKLIQMQLVTKGDLVPSTNKGVFVCAEIEGQSDIVIVNESLDGYTKITDTPEIETNLRIIESDNDLFLFYTIANQLFKHRLGNTPQKIADNVSSSISISESLIPPCHPIKARASSPDQASPFAYYLKAGSVWEITKEGKHIKYQTLDRSPQIFSHPDGGYVYVIDDLLCRVLPSQPGAAGIPLGFIPKEVALVSFDTLFLKSDKDQLLYNLTTQHKESTLIKPNVSQYFSPDGLRAIVETDSDFTYCVNHATKIHQKGKVREISWHPSGKALLTIESQGKTDLYLIEDDRLRQLTDDAEIESSPIFEIGVRK